MGTLKGFYFLKFESTIFVLSDFALMLYIYLIVLFTTHISIFTDILISVLELPYAIFNYAYYWLGHLIFIGQELVFICLQCIGWQRL